MNKRLDYNVWEQIAHDALVTRLRLKFVSPSGVKSELAKQLIETGDEHLTHGLNKNIIGDALMKVRKELLEAKTADAFRERKQEKKIFCEGCKQEIDEDVCHCGESLAAHNAYTGHPMVPMGCDCFRNHLDTIGGK